MNRFFEKIEKRRNKWLPVQKYSPISEKTALAMISVDADFDEIAEIKRLKEEWKDKNRVKFSPFLPDVEEGETPYLDQEEYPME